MEEDYFNAVTLNSLVGVTKCLSSYFLNIGNQILMVKSMLCDICDPDTIVLNLGTYCIHSLNSAPDNMISYFKTNKCELITILLGSASAFD